MTPYFEMMCLIQDSFTFTVAGKETEDLSADQFDMIFFTVSKVEDSYQVGMNTFSHFVVPLSRIPP